MEEVVEMVEITDKTMDFIESEVCKGNNLETLKVLKCQFYMLYSEALDCMMVDNIIKLIRQNNLKRMIETQTVIVEEIFTFAGVRIEVID